MWVFYNYFVSKIEPFQKTEMSQLTTAEKPTNATISPDGRYVAYVSGEDFDQSLWVAQIAGGNDVQVVAPAKVEYVGLTFSPNGDFIYFVRSQAPNLSIGILYRMPALGGTPEKLITDVTGRSPCRRTGSSLRLCENRPKRWNLYLWWQMMTGLGRNHLQ
jgi:Tol biopolymer transport system component